MRIACVRIQIQVHFLQGSVLLSVSDLENVTNYVFQQLAPSRQYLDSMHKAIPKLLESNRSLLESLVADKHSSKELEEKYLTLESLIPQLQDKLSSYGNMHIREYDFQVIESFIVISNWTSRSLCIS